MPAVLKSVGLVSPFRSLVTNDADGNTACPRFSKNSKNRERISEADSAWAGGLFRLSFMGEIVA